MKEENRMMQDEMMNEEEIIGKEIEKELENTPEKNTEKNAQKEKMINLMNRYHSSTGADKAEVVYIPLSPLPFEKSYREILIFPVTNSLK